MRQDQGCWRQAHNGGYLFKLSTEFKPPTPRERQIIAPVNEPPPNWDAIRFKLDFYQTEKCAELLGVSELSLIRLECGYSKSESAWVFPMRDARSRIIGYRVRASNGDKWALKGSKNGLFIPCYMSGEGPLLVCEGPTSLAALLDLQYDAIGRPSNSAGHDELIQYLTGIRRPIVIFIDRDPKDSLAERQTLKAAEKLAGSLTEHVKIVKPPNPYKDARQWLNRGATRPVVDCVINSALKYTVDKSLSVSTEREQSPVSVATGSVTARRVWTGA